MAYTVKARTPCVDCGVLTRRRLRKSRIACCVECGIKRAVDQSTQMYDKKGPQYDAWRAKMTNWATNQWARDPTRAFPIIGRAAVAPDADPTRDAT